MRRRRAGRPCERFLLRSSVFCRLISSYGAQVLPRGPDAAETDPEFVPEAASSAQAEKAIECRFDEWATWTDCSTTCGSGEKYRSRVSLTGADVCQQETMDTVACELAKCPQDCVVSDWTEWDECDRSCGIGRQKRSRQKLAEGGLYGGVVCQGPYTSSRSCNIDGCPEACVWGEWGDWSECTRGPGLPVTCGGGVRWRSRLVAKPRLWKGPKCVGEIWTGSQWAALEEEICLTIDCPEKCAWGDWAQWSACSATCGETGVRKQSREVARPPRGVGEECLERDRWREEPCGRTPCPIDCVLEDWTKWSACNNRCGGGNSTRKRKIRIKGMHGGKECPTEDRLVEHTQCETALIWQEWGPWGACSRTCGPGSQTRTRHAEHERDEVVDLTECPETDYRQQQQCDSGPCTAEAGSAAGDHSNASEAPEVDEHYDQRYEVIKPDESVARRPAALGWLAAPLVVATHWLIVIGARE